MERSASEGMVISMWKVKREELMAGGKKVMPSKQPKRVRSLRVGGEAEGGFAAEIALDQEKERMLE